MSFYYTKQPSEIERVGVDFNNRLPSGNSVASATYVVIDPAGTDVTTTLTVTGSGSITDNDSDGTDDTASIKVQAGTTGIKYKLTIVATLTSNSIILEEDIVIDVKAR